MAPNNDEEILSKIQETYVPFLKKLIAFLEKNKKSTPENLSKLKTIYTIFTTAPPQEQVETFHVNEKKLQNWHKKSQKDKNIEDNDATRKSKRLLASSDTESSQGGASEESAAKKKCTNFSNVINTESTTTVSSVNASQIKKEKMSPMKMVQPAKTYAVNSQPLKAQPTASQPAAAVTPKSAQVTTTPAAPPSGDEPIIFTCASCQFQTQEETEFMKHARTDHRTDLSMWCKWCGKCFSNAGVLVSHIKERACVKEDMIYKCGVKDCIFETTSGQTFVHHLRHCHKGSPFIFCVHCQKIFTLPHCLILHMQDDCPYKDRNRRNPSGKGAASSPPKPDPKPTPPSAVSQAATAVALLQNAANIRLQKPVISYGNRQVAPKVPTNAVTPTVRPQVPIVTASRGRGRPGRGRGRGRGRLRISDSSDSDDPDDPSWRPEESLGETGLRRSGRWAKKINDVMNPEPAAASGGTVSAAKKSFTSAELNEKMIECPCCDAMASFQSVLNDHYIAHHKVPNKNACLVCHLKFENIQAFFDHFEQHRNGSLPNKPPPEVVSEVAPKPPAKPIEIVENSSSNSESAKSEQNQSAPVTSKEVEPFDGVLTSIDDANLANPSADEDKAYTRIPYQASIHDKNLKDSKFKKFEELKSPNDLLKMKTFEKLKHYFKCTLYNCTYSTDIVKDFSHHLKTMHNGKRFHCCYCMKEDLNCDIMANHIAFKHNKRVFQCSKCFYRAYSKAHVTIHIKHNHSQEPYPEILKCDPIVLPDEPDEEEPSTKPLNTTWPYICAIGQCNFNTYNPKEFKKHNETTHRLVSVFFCHYCKVDFLTFKRLMNHYRLHGLNVFQCNYCIHGAENKDEILLHLCNAHADEPLKAYMRGSDEEATSELKQLNSVIHEESNSGGLADVTSYKQTPVENPVKDVKGTLFTGCENELYHIVDNKCYPKHMKCMCYPRYVKKLMSDLVCGIPFCNKTFETLSLYQRHLRDVHDALNYSCPHCPEMCDSWMEFKNHILCHGSSLYACGVIDCEYYDFTKERVREHKKMHENVDNAAVALREFPPNDEEIKFGDLVNEVDFPDMKETFTCLFCKHKSGDRNKMKIHMYKEMAYQRFDCSLCEKKCSSRKEIKEHFLSSHPDMDILCSEDYNIEVETMVRLVLEQQQRFQYVDLAESCDMCCQKIKNSLRLQSHIGICLQKEYRPYECRHCKKNCANLRNLKYHTDENHSPKCIEFTIIPNYAVEEDIEKNLLKIRLKQLKDIFEELGLTLDADEKLFKVKFYTCSDCAFEAHHKFNVQKHNKLNHDGMAKVMKGRECNLNSGDSISIQLDENSNDSICGKSLVKRFSCGYCVKKMLTIQEVEKHMRKSHAAKHTEFFYYYAPNSKSEFSNSDKDIYECAYCKSTKENLFSLKKHSDLMHSEMEFKVKGTLPFAQTQNNYLACGYCYLRANSQSQLQQHSALSHPLLALKSVGGFQAIKIKRPIDSVDDCVNKRVKFNADVYVCSHCGGAFSSVESVTLHSRKAHSRFPLKYIKKDQVVIKAESTDLKFYKCEFCRFTSEKQFLEKHIATKHKSRVTCSYCNKRFEYASKLKEHHDEFHKDLPLKYSQETINLNVSSVNSSSNEGIDKNDENKSVNIPELASYYGRKPEPMDYNLTVHMKTNEGYIELPVMYLKDRFNLFPVVLLKDLKKEKKDD